MNRKDKLEDSQIFANLPRATRAAETQMTPTPGGNASSTKLYDMTPITIDKIIEQQKYQDDETAKARKELFSKKYEVDSLRNKLMLLTTAKQELELNQEILHSKFYNSVKVAVAKETELNSLEDALDLELNNLSKTAELHKKELQLNHQSRLHKLNQTFENKIDQTLRNKVRYIESQKAALRQDIEEQESKLKDITNNTRQSRIKIIQKYDEKANEVSDMIQGAKATIEEEENVLEVELTKKDGAVRQLKSQSKTLEEENMRLQRIRGELEIESDRVISRATELESQIENIGKENANLDGKTTGMDFEMRSLKRNTESITDQFEIEERKRRLLNNVLQDLKGNIRVFCRFRPQLRNESSSEITSLIFPENLGEENQEHLVVEDPKISERATAPSIKTVPKKHRFKFDKVFDMRSNNADIFEEISPLVQSSINGYNICLFAYGQTGSGKTYTMSEPEIGMIPRTVHQIFEDISTLSKLKNSPWEYKIKGKFLEIYNENIVDLISDQYNPSRKHEIRHDADRLKTTVTGLTEIELTSASQVDAILRKANRNRSTASTKANERSSRSHSIFILDIRGNNKLTKEVSEGTLNLIDLAGSERLSHSQSTGDRLKETQAINKSLSALGDVIAALGQQNGSNNHIPFRNSKLTYLLQYSLSGNSKTLMFVNVSPMACHFNETINSLRFAMKVNNTKIN